MWVVITTCAFINTLSVRSNLQSKLFYIDKFYHSHQLTTINNFKMSSQQIFVSRTAFDAVLDQYIQKHHESKRPKLFVTQDMYDEAIQILCNPENSQISDKKTRHWVNYAINFIASFVAKFLII